MNNYHKFIEQFFRCQQRSKYICKLYNSNSGVFIDVQCTIASILAGETFIKLGTIFWFNWSQKVSGSIHQDEILFIHLSWPGHYSNGKIWFNYLFRRKLNPINRPYIQSNQMIRMKLITWRVPINTPNYIIWTIVFHQIGSNWGECIQDGSVRNGVNLKLDFFYHIQMNGLKSSERFRRAKGEMKSMADFNI